MYSDFSIYYDKFHAQVSEDIPLVLEISLRAGGPILELGCGSGRLLLPLARAGLEVIGLDNSPEMLAILESEIEKEGDRLRDLIHIKQHDFREPTDITPPPNGILIGFNTLFHINHQQLDSSLKYWHQLLNPGGLLYIDILNPLDLEQLESEGEHGALSDLPFEEEFTFQDEEADVKIQSRSKVEQAGQIYRVEWLMTRNTESYSTIFEFYYYYLHQIQLALDQAGFNIRSIWGDYDKTPYNEESERLIILATKEG